MNASDLREWVALFMMDLQPDGQGGYRESIPADLSEDRPAKVEQPSGSLVGTADQLADRALYQVTIRYEPAITTAFRVYWRGMYLDVQNVQNVESKNEWLKLDCIRREMGGQ